MAIVKGIDLEKLEAFQASLKENPVTLGLESKSAWEGHSGRNTTHIGPDELGGQKIDRGTRRYTFSYGAWREVEEAIGFVGSTDQVEPVEMVLGAMGACLTNSIALNAPRHGIDLEGMEIIVHADIDPSVLFEVKGPDQHGACISNISCEVKVQGGLSQEQLTTIQRLIDYSPVHGMVAHLNNITSKVSKA